MNYLVTGGRGVIGSLFARRLVRDGHRVTIIETQRLEESKQALKRGAWAGFWAAAGITALLELVRVIVHRP